MLVTARIRRWMSGLVLVVALGGAGCGYNTIQTYDEQVNAAASQIKVQLQRRADLIPNLVETVKGYAKQEQTVFIEVAQARAKLDRKSTRLNSSHVAISYAVFCLKKKKKKNI